MVLPDGIRVEIAQCFAGIVEDFNGSDDWDSKVDGGVLEDCGPSAAKLPKVARGWIQRAYEHNQARSGTPGGKDRNDRRGNFVHLF